MTPLDRLARFADDHGYLKGRGALNVGLVMTRRARDEGLPLHASQQLAASGGQVRGLSGRAGDAILKDYGVSRSIGTEVGRTNRKSVQQMRDYIQFLNDAAQDPLFDLAEFEKYWVDQFIARFASQPFRLRREVGNTTQAIIRDLIIQATDRQREGAGAMIVGTVLQHLVGAKLEAALNGRATITHHSANTSDQHGRGGDFDIGDTAIHVTVTPTELLLSKCSANIESGIRPVIVTTSRGTQAVEVMAEPRGLTGRVEVYAVEQFVALNIIELGCFSAVGTLDALKDVIERYNRIVDTHEVDPSLRITWG